MKTKFLSLLIVPVALSVSACGDTWGQRALTGGGIGAGTGLLVGAVAGFPLIGAAVVGTALGAGIGAATAPGGIK
jgi:osmotically inducible lipoprotein OsmB